MYWGVLLKDVSLRKMDGDPTIKSGMFFFKDFRISYNTVMGPGAIGMLFCQRIFTISLQEHQSPQIIQEMAATCGHFQDFPEGISPYRENNQKKKKDYFLGRGLKTFS
jgi:hypothetical protein